MSQKFSKDVLPISYSNFPDMVEPGDNIFVGRYLVSGADASSLYLRVDSATETTVTCTAQSSAVLSGLLTVFHTERSDGSVANQQNDLPPLTDYDKAALRELAREYDIDFVSLSYCREGDDVDETRAFLHSIGSASTKIIAKCETRQSLFHFRSILNTADGIIISRGNLGLDVPPEKMAIVQKSMISACIVMGKPSLITRVVDTMIVGPRPTRAEATDIANAVLDGVDGILLGAETYRGTYAIEAVKTTVAIAREAEAAFDHKAHFDYLGSEMSQFAAGEGSEGLTARAIRDDILRNASTASLQSEIQQFSLVAGMIPKQLQAANPSTATVANVANSASGTETLDRLSKLEAVASSAVRAADKVGASMIIVVTQHGSAAALVAKYRPAVPIMTLVVPYLKRDGLHWKLEGRSAARQALLTSGLMPVLAAPTPNPGQGESLIEEALVLAVNQGVVQPDDHVVTISRAGAAEFMLKIVSVNETGTGIKQIRPKSLLNILRGHGQQVPAELFDDLEEQVEEEAEANGQITVQDVAEVEANGEVAPGAVMAGGLPPGRQPSMTITGRPELSRGSVLMGHGNQALFLQSSPSAGKAPSLARLSSATPRKSGSNNNNNNA